MERATIGRRVWVWSDSDVGVRDPKQAFDAGVVYVHPQQDVDVVDLIVTDHYGVATNERNITLRTPSEADQHGSGRRYATWMPYQMKAAAKAAKVEDL
jgi:hypothetical protein